MAHLISGFQLPFQRRLTKMYSDTKKSYDFVKEPVQNPEDPELKSLYRKLRIQKDRLVTWGLNWSDSSKSPDIDESLSRAGLGEVVGNVMTTIKEILAEAEPLWQSSQRASSVLGDSSNWDRKAPLISWDRSRFEDLVKDLTDSIDILYDATGHRLNTQQRSVGGPTHREPTGTSSFANNKDPLQQHLVKPPLASTYAPLTPRSNTPDEGRLFESTRVRTPQQIDPADLIRPEDLVSSIDENVRRAIAVPEGSRQIVFLKRQSSTNPWKTDETMAPLPVFLEYASYDPIYANTGISPPITRFEKIFAALQVSQESTRYTDRGLLNLIGYFDDADQARFGLLYGLPQEFSVNTNLDQYGKSHFHATACLSDLLASPKYEPALEEKFHLAHTISKSVIDLHLKSIEHGNLSANNIVFFYQRSTGSLDDARFSEVKAHRPFLASFDVFSGDDEALPHISSQISDSRIYRHPDDPRINRQSSLKADDKALELYTLALLLFEVGLWRPLSAILSSYPGVHEDPSAILRQLAIRCGSLYSQATMLFWKAPGEQQTYLLNYGRTFPDKYRGVVQALEKLTTIDDCLEMHLKSIPPLPAQLANRSSPPKKKRTPVRTLSKGISERPIDQTKELGQSKTQRDVEAKFVSEPLPTERSMSENRTETWLPEKQVNSSIPPTVPPAVPPRKAPPQPQKTKLRIYPSVRLSQEQLDDWRTSLMPKINQALRNFYKKHAESVEISLESVGGNSLKTKPTIVVVCSSVDKVKKILKTHFQYDKSQYGLKVLQGRIVRSGIERPQRSMANDADMPKAANPDYQSKPRNGASIGACIENEHLPPVSFGGLIMIDEKPYGMTVHHMLDNPNDEDDQAPTTFDPPLRSSGYHLSPLPDFESQEGLSGYSGDLSFSYEFSDSDSDSSSIASFDDSDSILSEESDESRDQEPGDIEGIPVDCGESYAVTQPAIDDVDESFFSSDEAADEEHLDSCKLGHIYASSGIRRRRQNGMTHEIDWALFEFLEDRMPCGNCIKDGDKFCKLKPNSYPTQIAKQESMAERDVHCMARTTGLQNGRIRGDLASVKIQGRTTPSESWQVSGGLGIPGDSGAWVISSDTGALCGHVLAWSVVRKVAYICPMEVLVEDIVETVKARRVGLPDGELYIDRGVGNSQLKGAELVGGFDQEEEGDEEDGVRQSKDDLANLKLQHLPSPAILDHPSGGAPERDMFARDYGMKEGLAQSIKAFKVSDGVAT